MGFYGDEKLRCFLIYRYYWNALRHDRYMFPVKHLSCPWQFTWGRRVRNAPTFFIVYTHLHLSKLYFYRTSHLADSKIFFSSRNKSRYYWNNLYIESIRKVYRLKSSGKYIQFVTDSFSCWRSRFWQCCNTIIYQYNGISRLYYRLLYRQYHIAFVIAALLSRCLVSKDEREELCQRPKLRLFIMRL